MVRLKISQVQIDGRVIESSHILSLVIYKNYFEDASFKIQSIISDIGIYYLKVFENVLFENAKITHMFFIRDARLS